MTFGKNDIFLLPEILFKISEYLDEHELFNCILVNKTLNNCLLPVLWRNININLSFGTSRKLLRPEYLSTHRQYVVGLKIVYQDPSKFGIHFPNLRELKVHCLSFKIKDRVSPLKVLELNTSVVNLSMGSSGLHLNLADWNCILAYPNLSKLVLSCNMTDHTHWKVFWKICEKLSTLHFFNVHPEIPPPLDDTTTFPRLRELRIDNKSRHMSLASYTDLLSKFPGLEELHTPLSSSICQGSGSKWWPNIRNLTVLNYVSDEDLSTVVKSTRQVVTLSCAESHFGPLTFNALKPRLNTIVDLKLNRIAKRHDYTQAIFCSAPHLRYYFGSEVAAKEIADGQPWVCLQLSRLVVNIRFESTEDHLQPLVFRQLSRLILLRLLNVGSLRTKEEYDGEDIEDHEELSEDGVFLKFNLDHGMGQLSGLKMLEYISADRTNQNITEKDVKWMEGNFVSLEVFHGSGYVTNTGSSSRIHFT